MTADTNRRSLLRTPKASSCCVICRHHPLGSGTHSRHIAYVSGVAFSGSKFVGPMGVAFRKIPTRGVGGSGGG